MNLRRLTIRPRLMVVLAVPVLVMLLLVAARTVQELRDGRRADRLVELHAYTGRLLSLTHALQRERELAVGDRADPWQPGGERLPAQRAEVDRALHALELEGGKLRRGDSRLGGHTLAAERGLAGLGGRRAVLDQPSLPALEVLDGYTDVVDELLRLMGQVPVEFEDPSMSRNLATLVRLCAVEESVRYQQGLELALGPASPGRATAQRDADRHDAATAAVDARRSDLLAFATPGQREALAGTVEVGRFRDLERELLDGVRRGVVDGRVADRRTASTESILILLVLLCSVGVSLLMAQSMIASFLRLKRSALDLVERRLPRVVERLERGERIEEPTAEGEVPTAPVGGRSEIGEVAAAFQRVHQTAVQIANEQAMLRDNVTEIFVGFARRNQGLIGRQLELIDEFRRRSGDPAAEAELAHLGRWAARMRRNAEDLMVLSGATLPRRWARPVPLREVVDAALEDVEERQRIHSTLADEPVVQGDAASDLAPLLAELLDNATTFSPPYEQVHLTGQLVGAGYLLEVEDCGIGMSDTDLIATNERLTSPARVDLATPQRLGLQVAARLAARHRIKLRLRQSRYGGVTALLLVPEVLVTTERRGPAIAPGARA